MKQIILLILILCVLFIPAFGQTSPIVQSHERVTIKSNVLGEERSILVRIPTNYGQSGESYPVVYMLDGHPPHISHLASTIEYLAWSGQIPEMIMVSIQNTDRTRDLTPTKSNATRPDGKTLQYPTSGGGDKFLKYIETEVIPLIVSKYRTQPFRIFAGHSLGGLLVVHSLISRPELFNAYIAASPTLHWDNKITLNRADEFFKQKKELKKTIFVALGDESNYLEGFNQFKEMLNRYQLKGFDYEFRQFPEETHSSVALQSYYWGLRKIWAGWLVPQTAQTNVVELEKHFGQLSSRFGYKIPITETFLNRIGYQLLNSGKVEDAILVFKENVESYPSSANAYDSLGEALERSEQYVLAKQSYEKALCLAEKSGNVELTKTIRESLERVQKKAQK